MNDEEFAIEYLPEDFLQYDLSFKIIVIGESGNFESYLRSWKIMLDEKSH
jgi:hypothetical protein